MPSKGTTLKNGDRLNFVDRKFCNELLKETGLELTHAQIKEIISSSNQLIQERIVDNPVGFKFPEYMGYGIVTRFKPKPGSRAIDFHKTKLAGKTVYHTNFHSFGYIQKISWLTHELSSCKYLGVYKFVADRKFSRSVATKAKEGKVYTESGHDFFKMRRIRVNLNKLS